MGKAARIKAVKASTLKLDFGCGPNPREGFIGVDRIKFDKVELLCDLTLPGKFLFSKSDDVPQLVKYYGPKLVEGYPAILGRQPYELPDSSVAEAHASHFLEHLTNVQRVNFVNELWRILVLGGTCQIIVPHWASNRAYGDPTHQWPPVSEMWFYYLNRDWRKDNAPHTSKEHWPDGFDCNFEATWGYTLRADLNVRNDEYRQMAMQNYKEVCQDIIATLTKRT